MIDVYIIDVVENLSLSSAKRRSLSTCIGPCPNGRENPQIPRQILHKIKNQPKLIETDLTLTLSILDVLAVILRKLD